MPIRVKQEANQFPFWNTLEFKAIDVSKVKA
jgi:hypothetical protein